MNLGWQEPGFWRPKWVMDREFDNEEDNEIYPKRIYFKLNSDKTVKVFKTEYRPKLEIGKEEKQRKEKPKKLFETGNEKVLTTEEKIHQLNKNKEKEEVFDGGWTWADAAPLAQAKVTIETKECVKDKEEKLRHDCRCDWGKLDGYAPLFRRGKIYKYKLTPAGIPIGTYAAGTFTVKVSPFRPIVSKDFLAIQ